ncbi:hypothetical protein V5O48_005602 [Marasmius crinis-equi]|uniref:SprT-like domain-containing protein n=1 Tax=Marasmius crinis-equi TaxID=585013 RepID=A0ABR3FLT2_9AGAR
MSTRASAGSPRKTGSSKPNSGTHGTPSKARKNVEVVPDSEEERVHAQASAKILQKPSKEVIVISSDEEDQPAKNTPPRTKAKAKSFPKSRRIVESSTESEDELPVANKGKGKGSASKSNPHRRTEVILVPRLSLYQDEEDSTDEYYVPPERDEAVLTYDGPLAPKKPMRVPSVALPQLPHLRTSSIGGSVSNPATPTKSKSNKSSEKSATPSTNTPTQASPSKRKPSKKALEEARLTALFEYAQNFFHEINAAVFGNGLPRQTELIWNKKLLTTAGKAKWNKGRNEVAGYTKIELAPKILDCEGMNMPSWLGSLLRLTRLKERIRKTLAHEMCHLACWIIDGNIAENHGPLFKSWASKVTRARPDITISTTHDYAINHPYRWQCVDCSLIYGRFSKSINPSESRCGKCGNQNDPTKGTLVALHKERAKKTPQTPTSKISRMAAGKPRDSPSSIVSRKAISVAVTEIGSSLSDDEDEVEFVELMLDVSTSTTAGGCAPPAESASDSDIEFIAFKLNATTLKA